MKTNGKKTSKRPKSSDAVFISYNRVDSDAAEQVATRLEGAGVTVWLDRWSLLPGDPFVDEISRALEVSSACICLIGTSGIGPWQNDEMRLALDRRAHDPSFLLIPVLLPGVKRPERLSINPLLLTRAWVELKADLDQRTLERLLQAIRRKPVRARLASKGGSPVDSPYQGLKAFEAEDARFFFGRERTLQWTLDKLRFKRPNHIRRFLAVLGPSGSGKSSFVRAGLISHIRNGDLPGSERWPLVVCKPGSDPVEGLAIALTMHGSLTIRLTARDQWDA